MDNKWFLISDTRILRQQKLQCSSRDISGPYILIQTLRHYLGNYCRELTAHRWKPDSNREYLVSERKLLAMCP